MTVQVMPGARTDDLVDGPRVAFSYLAAKRLLDCVVAAMLLIVLAPLMMAIAIAVWLDDGPPALFAQERVGSRARRPGFGAGWELYVFNMWKFRTMRVSPENALVHEAFARAFVNGDLAAVTASPAAYKLAGDPRVTRVGRWLRSTSLDELPQLFNVLAGDMSLVGPRPVPVYEVMAYAPRHRRRLGAKPGMTGIWQVDGRGRVGMEEMVRMDVEYIERRSLLLDLSLLCRTLPAVLSGKGAQ
jgi:lipopolysaccharide/colanic/teichoic acid biosynthesis glycosyltransferase